MQPVDVVVVSYNSSRVLRDCVSTLAGYPEVEVVVVDNASDDASLATIADLRVRRIQLDSNLGFSYGCNVGWRSGGAPFVLFLNPDGRVEGRAVERLVRTLEDHPRAGVVGPRIVEQDGSLDYSIRRFPRLRSTFAQAVFLHRVFPAASWTDEIVRDRARYDEPGPAEWVSGACFLVRRTVLEQLGGLDDGFFLYCEDKDFCRRVWDLGYEVRFEPDALAVHEGGASAPRASLFPVLARSRIRYARKHRSRPAAAVERAGIALGAMTHVAVGRGGSEARAGYAAAFRAAVSRIPGT